jgi:hypothetical protein
MPNTILNNMLVHSGWSNFLSVDLTCRLSQLVRPNTAKKSFSKALIGLSLTATQILSISANFERQIKKLHLRKTVQCS